MEGPAETDGATSDALNLETPEFRHTYPVATQGTQEWTDFDK